MATDALISAIRAKMEAAAQGWVAPPLSPGVAATLSAVSKERFGQHAGFVGEGGSMLADLQKGFPGTQFVATGVLGALERARAERVAPHPMAKAVTQAVATLLQWWREETDRADPGEAARWAGKAALVTGGSRGSDGQWCSPSAACRSRRRRHQPQVRRLPGGGGRGGGSKGAAGPARGLPRGA